MQMLLAALPRYPKCFRSKLSFLLHYPAKKKIPEKMSNPVKPYAALQSKD
jgi:hypothetical protein